MRSPWNHQTCNTVFTCIYCKIFPGGFLIHTYQLKILGRSSISIRTLQLSLPKSDLPPFLLDPGNPWYKNTISSLIPSFSYIKLCHQKLNRFSAFSKGCLDSSSYDLARMAGPGNVKVSDWTTPWWRPLVVPRPWAWPRCHWWDWSCDQVEISIATVRVLLLVLLCNLCVLLWNINCEGSFSPARPTDTFVFEVTSCSRHLEWEFKFLSLCRSWYFCCESESTFDTFLT